MKNKLYLFRNNLKVKGQALLPVLIGIGVVAIIALGNAMYVSNMRTSIKNNSLSSENDNLLFATKQVLSSADGCLANLGTAATNQTFNPQQGFSSVNLKGLYYPLAGGAQGPAFATLGNRTRIGSNENNLILKKATLVNKTTNSATSYLAVLNIAVQKTGTFSGASSLARPLPVQITTDANHNIISCITSTLLLDQFCQSLNMTLDPATTSCVGSAIPTATACITTGQALQGFDFNGNPQCVPYAVSTPPPAQYTPGGVDPNPNNDPNLPNYNPNNPTLPGGTPRFPTSTCTRTCPFPDQICSGNFINDTCGGVCPATKSCDSFPTPTTSPAGQCPDPSTLCPGQKAVGDSSGNTCTGSKQIFCDPTIAAQTLEGQWFAGICNDRCPGSVLVPPFQCPDPATMCSGQTTFKNENGAPCLGSISNYCDPGMTEQSCTDQSFPGTCGACYGSIPFTCPDSSTLCIGQTDFLDCSQNPCDGGVDCTYYNYDTTTTTKPWAP